jgi:hypothetical protein
MRFSSRGGSDPRLRLDAGGKGDDRVGAPNTSLRSRVRPARPVLRSGVQVPSNHSCEAIAPVRLISVDRRRNLNGDSLMHTVDRGREWPYFDVSHCSTLQSGGSAVRPNAASGRTQRLRVVRVSRAAKTRPQSTRERPLSRWEWGGKPETSVQTEQSHIYRNCDLRMPKPHLSLIFYIDNHST